MANDILSGAASGLASGAVTGLTASGGNPWGALIGGVIGLGAGIYGGSKAAKKRKQMAGAIARQQSDNDSWYNRTALSDYTQRADAQAYLTRLRAELRANARTAAGAAAVTGATPEQVAADKERINKAVANAYTQLGAMGQQVRDNAERTYLNRRDALTGAQLGFMNNQATSYENLMNNGFQQFGNTAAAFGNYLNQRRNPANT
jgi:hypothetical protein